MSNAPEIPNINQILQNLSISSVKPPEVENRPLRDKDALQINFYLQDIYGKQNKTRIQEKIEPLYEEMRKKFQNSFNKQQPSFYIRIPYYKVLIGDQITNIFEDKIVTTMDKDLIICGRETDENLINIELFDEYYPSVTLDLDKIKLEIEEKSYFENSEILNAEFIKYVYSAYKYAKELINPKRNKGFNLLIGFNSVNGNVKNKFSEKAKYMNLFAATYLATFKVFDYLEKIPKKKLFEFLWDDLNKVNNFANEYVYLLAMFSLEANSIGVYHEKQFNQFKVSEDMGILYCNTLTPAPPMIYSQMNYWNKRKIEFKLAVAIILKKLNKEIQFEELLKITSNFNDFLRHFDHNLEIIQKTIEIHLKETPYKLKELKEEFSNIDIKKLLFDIESGDYILSSAKDFSLRPRITFILKEYERVVNIHNALTNLKDKSNEYFRSRIMSQISESSQAMSSLYNCFSDEMINLIKKIEGLSNEIAIKIGSDGWGGDLFVIGNEKILVEINNYLEKHFEFLNSKDNLANMWHYDFEHFCDHGNLGGTVAVLNPEFEDFMFM